MAIADERNRELNTPKAWNIADLFEKAVGIDKVPSSWRWQGMSTKQAADKLDRHVSLRGDIAHRSKAADRVKKATARDFKDHVGYLVERTDEYVNDFITKACDVPLF